VAFCLMPNHVHQLLIPPSREALISMTGDLHHKYSKYLNYKMRWTGRLWQGRYYSVPMDHEHTQQCIPYIEANPIRAGLVKYNEQYKWVSQNVPTSQLFEQIVDYESIRVATRTGRPSGNEKFMNQVKQVTGLNLENCRKRGRPKKE
jgi:putative transposase